MWSGCLWFSNKMKVLIVEDEHPASQKLLRMLEEVDSTIEVVGVLRSVEESINWFSEHPSPELVFMDIQLEDGLSFDIFEKCKIDVPIIFTTSYDEFTLKAFKLNSVDYLLKPISQDELKGAINKFNTIHKKRADYAKLESVIKQLQPQRKERFLVRIGDHYKSFPISEVYCFYINERCTFLFTNTAKSYSIDYSLDQIEQVADPMLFFRVNRNFIINFSAIRDAITFSSNRLKVFLANWAEDKEILVSRERVADFKKWMDR